MNEQIRFLEFFERFWTNSRENVMQFSARTSPCSAIPSWFTVSEELLPDARHCLALLVALEFSSGTGDYYRMEPLRQHIANKAKRYSYQGRWSDVKSYLETVKPQVLRESLSFLLNIMSLDDFFGNFLPLLKKFWRNIEVKVQRTLASWELPRVKYPKRKRGYDDRGSRSLAHEFHGISTRIPYGEPERESIRIIEPRPYRWFRSLRE